MPALIRGKRSTTLFEVIISTVIFALVMGGLARVFVSGKRQVLHTMERMTSSEMGKVFLDPLQLAVRQDNWDTVNNALTVGTTYCDASGVNQNPACPSLALHRNVNGINYTARYDVATFSTNLRRVKVTINWTEVSP